MYFHKEHGFNLLSTFKVAWIGEILMNSLTKFEEYFSYQLSELI